jgi:hypothetical protein
MPQAAFFLDKAAKFSTATWRMRIEGEQIIQK